METPKTLLEAVRYFTSLDACHALMLELKWPDGNITCPKCGGNNVGNIASRRMLQCRAKDCRKQFSAKVGTIFEDSPLGLDKWFVAVWSIANAKNGISSCEVARALGVTQKTAWFMLHRIRTAMNTNTFKKLAGEVESDETFIGGKAANMHAKRREKVITGRGPVGKAIVHGILQRAAKGASKVVASVIPNVESDTIVAELAKNVERDSAVYSDASTSYVGMWPRFYHDCVDHSVEYVRGRVHTNGLENFWSLLKRGLGGTYIHVAPFHLFRYLDEQVFRFNERKGNDASRFKAVMQSVIGRRLTYRQLCAIGGAGFMGLE